MIKKLLFIEKVLYSRLKFLFIFNNAISYLIYIKNAFKIGNINKSLDEK